MATKSHSAAGASEGTAPCDPSENHKELLLRYYCPGCKRRHLVSLSQLGNKARCPECGENFSFPTLTGTIIGLDEVATHLSKISPPTWKAQCPACDHAIDIAHGHLGGDFRCNTCGALLRTEVSQVGRSVAEPSLCPVSQGAEHRPAPTVRPAGARPTAHSPAGRSHVTAVSPYAQTTDSPVEADGVDVVTEDRRPHSSPHRSARVRSAMPISPRVVRNLLHYGIWLGPIVFLTLVALSAGRERAIALFCVSIVTVPWFMFGHWPARWITPLVLGALFRSIRCPRCHEQYPAVNLWSCGCGYQPPSEKNVFLFRCKLCSASVGHIRCERCQTTIFI